MKLLLFAVLLGFALWLISNRMAKQPAAKSMQRPALMGREQALAILGLENQPVDRAAIIDAHRRLMQKVHPDKGGSALLAQQLNEAKRTLLSQDHS